MIELKNVSYNHYNESMRFSLLVKKNERLAVLGPSGAGKSTLLNLISGFIFPNSGEIILNGQNSNKTPPNQRPVTMLFQENNLFNHLSVYQNMALGINTSLKLNDQERDELLSLAKRVNLIKKLTCYPHHLSGGEKQRVAIVRSLLQKKTILLLDEPFSSLDSSLRSSMLELVDEVCKKYQLTLVMVTHDINDAKKLAKQSILIEKGHIIFRGPTDKLPKLFF